jgi:tRNA (cmo5U34)-methyltransferase
MISCAVGSKGCISIFSESYTDINLICPKFSKILEINKLDSIVNDPSRWLTSERVRGYLERADKIPHRTEGENVLLDFIPKTTRKVLDLGTGDGRLIRLLKTKIPTMKCVAIDFSPPMLRNLKRQFRNNNSVTIIQHNLESSLPDMGYFDAVVSGLSLHHLKHDRKKSLYSEIYSVLNPGGIFYNFDHFASKSQRLSQYFRKSMGRQRAPNKDHEERLTDIETEIHWLTRIGFQDVDCYWKWLQFALLISFKPR